MTARRHITAARRLAIFERDEGRCHICGRNIFGGRELWELDHIIPLKLGGSDEDGNLAPVHELCHAKKTAEDQGHIAKAKRMQQREAGVRREPRSPIPESRRSKWKKKVDGTVVKR